MKASILRALQRTLPGNRGTQLVIKHNDQITVDPALMADALKEHRGKVFAGRPVRNQHVLDEWRQRHPYGCSDKDKLDKDQWRVRF